MWKLIKAEIEYNKLLFSFGLLFVLIVNIKKVFFDSIQSNQAISELGLAWINISILIVFIYLFSFRKSRRIRIHTLLPIPSSNLGLSRIFLFITFWGIITLILLVSYSISFHSLPGEVWIKEILSFLGDAFIINSTPLFNQDLYNQGNRKLKLILSIWFGIIMIMYICLVLFFTPAAENIASSSIASFNKLLRDFYFSYLGSLIIFIGGVMMLLFSRFTFSRRKSYLE